MMTSIQNLALNLALDDSKTDYYTLCIENVTKTGNKVSIRFDFSSLQALSLSISLSLSLSLSHTHTHTLSLSHTHTLSLSLSTPSHVDMHTHEYTHLSSISYCIDMMKTACIRRWRDHFPWSLVSANTDFIQAKVCSFWLTS